MCRFGFSTGWMLLTVPLCDSSVRRTVRRNIGGPTHHRTLRDRRTTLLAEEALGDSSFAPHSLSSANGAAIRLVNIPRAPLVHSQPRPVPSTLLASSRRYW